MQKIMGVLLAAASFPAFSITTAAATVPEPGALSLLGIGAVAGILIWAKNRNQKK